jgi:gluconolactonase
LASQRISQLYKRLNSEDYFEGSVQIAVRVPDAEAFTEGPAMGPDGSVFFTNIPVSRIYRWNPKRRQLSVFREDSGKANGLLVTPEGDLLVCEQSRGRVTRINLENGRSEIVADQYDGKPIEPPNDLIIDRRGRIFFSSRPTSTVLSRGALNSVYRVDPGGEISRILVEPDVHMPNGLALSPDEKTLYLVEAHPDERHNRHIRAYTLNEEGGVSDRLVMIDFYPGRSGDGMCVDRLGNLYVAAGLHARRGTSETLDTLPGIHVISPSGKLLAFAETPVDTVSNCTFGGPDHKTLYITCGPYLLSVRTRIGGQRV